MTKKRKTILIITLAVIVLFAAGGIYAYMEYNRKSDVLTKTKPDFTKSPNDLINEFVSNEKDANSKYLDKVILVPGNIKSIDKDDKGYYTIALGDTTSMSSVRCSIDSTFTNEASLLQTNVSISIKGVCTGFNADEMGLGSDVILNRCIIIKQ